MTEVQRPTWTDTHCHLTDAAFDADREDAIERARGAGVARIVVVGDTVEASAASLELATRYEGLYAAAGVHPHNAEAWTDDSADALARIADEGADKIVAIGEMGLDFYYDNSPRDAQAEAFVAQADLARRLGKPMIMHCRSAYDTFLELIEKHDMASVGGVVHCFSGSVDEARLLTEMGFYLGIGGVATFKKADTLREAVRAVGPDRLVLETDAPYLAPIPKRGKRNEPAYAAITAERIAEELGMNPMQLSETLERNTDRLFGIGRDAVA